MMRTVLNNLGQIYIFICYSWYLIENIYYDVYNISDNVCQYFYMI